MRSGTMRSADNIMAACWWYAVNAGVEQVVGVHRSTTEDKDGK
jgi:hypothetical protein